MGKETKIGLIVVGVLAGALLGVVVKKFLLPRPAPAVEESQLFAQPVQQTEKPTVVQAQKERGAEGSSVARDDAWARGADGETAAGVPHGSFLPAEAPPTDGGVAPLPAAPEESVAEAAPSTAEAPQELKVAPEEPAALEASREPPARPRNPLRRLSAEVPFDESQADGSLPPLEASLPEDAAVAAPEEPSAAETPTEPETAPAEPSGVANPFDAPQAGAEPSDTMPAEPAGRSRYDADDPTPVTPAEPAAPVEPSMPADGRYAVQPNDSLWKISEKVYGDGRYFKAIGEHNRNKLPRADVLTAGAVIEVPPAGELTQLYPSLCPKQRRSAVVKTRQAVPAAREPEANNGGYVVQEGDTLFDIARYKLGRASRWGEIFELNREVLGEDFDFLQPGLELKMPATVREQ